MKKLLLGSATLLMFSIAILIFQMSCKKDAVAQTGTSNYVLPAATTTSLGGVIIGNGLSITGNGTLSVNNNGGNQLGKILIQLYNPSTASGEIWIANYDGSDYHKINIVLPSGIKIQQEGRLSPDGQKLFFGASSAGGVDNYIYVCNIDGSNPQQLLTANSGQEDFRVAGAY